MPWTRMSGRSATMLIGRKFWLLLLLLGAVAVAADDAEVTEGDDGGDAEDDEGSGDMDAMDEDGMEDDDEIIVRPPAGPVKGTVVGKMEGMGGDMEDEAPESRCHTSDGNSFEGYLAFRGIPYPEPPLSERRFRDPEPREPWDEPIDGSEFAAKCPQVDPRPGRGAEWGNWNLQINCSTPYFKTSLETIS